MAPKTSKSPKRTPASKSKASAKSSSTTKKKSQSKSSTPKKTPTPAKPMGKIVTLQPDDVPVIRGAVAFRQQYTSSPGWQKWDRITRQAVTKYEGKWRSETVFPYVKQQMGRNVRFVNVVRKDDGTLVWYELDEEDTYKACRNKYQRVAQEYRQLKEKEEEGAAATTESAKKKKTKTSKKVEEDSMDVDEEDTDKKAPAAKKEEEKAPAAEEAAGEPGTPTSFFGRVWGFFGWG